MTTPSPRGRQTAIAAATLSFLTAAALLPLIGLALFWVDYAAEARPDIERPDLTGSIWWSAIVAATLLYTVVMLLIAGARMVGRRSSGPVFAAAGSAVVGVLAVGGLVVNTTTPVWEQPGGEFFAPVAIASRLFPVFPVLPLIALPPAVAAGVLAVLPATRRWCARAAVTDSTGSAPAP
ncbi:hypothetical protein ACAG26_20240 [Mycobacterium sp. pUA109]|uniref:hypothetical protein n=1 Tax=Mycobacterium sp. pUA109 TaxID=3238982 RepID=UPI00351AF583